MDYIKGAILGVVLTILLIGYVRLIAYLEKFTD